MFEQQQVAARRGRPSRASSRSVTRDAGLDRRRRAPRGRRPARRRCAALRRAGTPTRRRRARARRGSSPAAAPAERRQRRVGVREHAREQGRGLLGRGTAVGRAACPDRSIRRSRSAAAVTGSPRHRAAADCPVKSTTPSRCVLSGRSSGEPGAARRRPSPSAVRSMSRQAIAGAPAVERMRVGDLRGDPVDALARDRTPGRTARRGRRDARPSRRRGGIRGAWIRRAHAAADRVGGFEHAHLVAGAGERRRRQRARSGRSR